MSDRSEALYRALFESAVDGIIVIDHRGVVQSANPSVERLFGYPPAELVGRNVSVLMPPPFRDEHDGYLERYLATGEARIIGIGREVAGQRRDGSTFPLELAVSAVRFGDALLFLGTLRDVSARREIEAEYRQALKMEAIGRLAGSVAHDFNTLLGTIRGYGELLLRGLRAGEPLRLHAEQIQRAALRGAGLTRRLLSFSRRREAEAALIHPGRLVEELAPMLERLLGEDVPLRCHVQASLANVRVDPAQLEQVLVNLVVNSRDAMPRGGSLTLIARTFEAETPVEVLGGSLAAGSYALFEVVDNGIGIEPSILPRISEPFFTTKSAGQGTGLGLFIVQRFAQENHGGLIVESRPGEGTTVRLMLPSVRETLPPEPMVAEAEESVVGEGRLVLVVEDDPMFRSLLKEVLAVAGFRVLVAANPQDASRVAIERGAELWLLLSDLVMPGGDGAALCRELVAALPHLKVVLMSGYADDDLASREADPSCADAFLQKPFATAELLACLRGLAGAST